MDMHGLPPGMAPQTDVHLVCLGEGLDDLRHPLEEGTEFLGFGRCEVPAFLRSRLLAAPALLGLREHA
jgi:hypothetical protein